MWIRGHCIANFEAAGDVVTIARIVKPQGRHGEVLADLHTDFPERFAERRLLTARSARDEKRELSLQDFWPHKGRVVLKFAGVDSISAAEELTGWEIVIPREQRAPLESGAAYVSDLIGCKLIAGGRELGRVGEVQFGAGAAPLLVVREGGREFLLPWAEEFLESLDLGDRTLRMKVPDGLLELDAPLTAEEKAAQHRKRDL
ncbi:MAG: ribosome maturation factor RimM [Terriglobales bacterium]